MSKEDFLSGNNPVCKVQAFNPFGKEQADLTGDDTEEIDPGKSGLKAVMKYSCRFYYRRFEGFNTTMVTIY